MVNVHFCLAVLIYAIIARTRQTYGFELPIKKFVYNNNGLGSYSFEYETLDGSYRKEDGGIIPDGITGSLTVRGEYAFVDPDGIPHYVRYVADLNGYRPRLSNDIRYNDRRIV